MNICVVLQILNLKGALWELSSQRDINSVSEGKEAVILVGLSMKEIRFRTKESNIYVWWGF